MTANSRDVLGAFDRIRVWQRGDQRAPHKPLLVLLMLGRFIRGEESARFEDIQQELGKLLERFGPAGAAASRQLPFWHLRSDGIWVLDGPASILDRPAGASPQLSEARKLSGRFTPEILDKLRGSPDMVGQIAQRIASSHFPESLQQDVLAAVGLEGLDSEVNPPDDRKRRDPRFRERVLLAYEYRCCVCRHDLRLDGQVVGLEAAHIKWVQAKGPDIEPNGFALCSLHHKLFDLGVFTVLPDEYMLVVSQHVTGSEDVRARLMSFHGGGIVLPQSRSAYPSAEFLSWHEGQVFKKPRREI